MYSSSNTLFVQDLNRKILICKQLFYWFIAILKYCQLLFAQMSFNNIWRKYAYKTNFFLAYNGLIMCTELYANRVVNQTNGLVDIMRCIYIAHWAPLAPLTPAEPHWPSLSPKDSCWAHPLTSTESHWAKCSLHLPPLSYIHPSVTHNDSFLSQMSPIWPQIPLNNIRLFPNCLKRPQPNQLCKLSSMYATFPPKKATNHALWP